MKIHLNKNIFLFSSLFLLLFAFILVMPVSAEVSEIETNKNTISKTEITDATNGELIEEDSNWLKDIWNGIKEIGNKIKDQVREAVDWVVDEGKDFLDWWKESGWEGVKDFFSQEWVKTTLKVIGAIVAVAGVILLGVFILAAVGITVAVSVIIGAIVFGIVGVLTTLLGGDDSFGGMLAGGLSSGISSLLGFGVFRALSFSKLLPATGILRQLSLGILGGSGAVGFTLLQGSLHYLFTGDSTYLKEAVTWENMLFNLAFGAVMGPLAAKLFSKPGVNQAIKGPGKWLATILAKKTGKPLGAISSAISSAWQTVKATASISAISSLLIGGFDSFKQYKQNGEVDWKKTGQRTAMIFTTTLVFGVALGLGPKFMMKGCACDDPPVSQVQQSEKNVTEKSVTKGTGNVNLKNIDEFIDGTKTFDDVVDEFARLYSEKIQTNKTWSWNKSFHGGEYLTARQRKSIKEKQFQMA
ncbi:hypothetical protein [Peribacillus psychrosaccharolyticus]|uniref:hypothetical protein n=1 Tax=Peribacillus psychrosaccharolyticus TaxID=1407 RepID=UPI0003161A0D|nr:hypothetical protein [Peribacillus psychrosaccharolyticus]